jgi:hypothetical protein
MGNGRVSTSKFAVTFWPFSSHRHRRSARLRRCQARRTSLPRLKAIEAWTDVEIGGASGRFGEVARASADERHSDLAVALRLVFSRTVGHSTRGGRNGVGLGDRTRRRSPSAWPGSIIIAKPAPNLLTGGQRNVQAPGQEIPSWFPPASWALRPVAASRPWGLAAALSYLSEGGRVPHGSVDWQ